MSRVLIVLTGSDHWTLADGTKHASGYWPEELVVPHQIFRQEGVDFTIATPGGVPATADEAGFTPEMNGGDAAKGQELRDYIKSTAMSSTPRPISRISTPLTSTPSWCLAGTVPWRT